MQQTLVETLFAATGLALCLALLVGMAIGPARRLRLQRWLRRLLRWRRDRRDARREATEAIERVRRRVDRDGNVYRPKAFGGDDPRPPDDKLH